MARQTNEAGFTHNDVVKAVKKGLGHSATAAELGVSISQLSMLEYCEALVEIGTWDEIPATSAAVRKAKDKDKNRWELIAARTGESVAKVKSLYGDEDDVKAAAIRGRGGSGNGASAEAETTTTSRRGGRTRGRKADTAAETAGTPRRARTRAARRAAAGGNPS